MAEDIAVVICAHDEGRLAMTLRCVESVLAGTRLPDEVLVVVDGNPSLCDTLRSALRTSPATVLANDGRGVSDARTTACGRARSSVIAFIDDDAWAEARWLEEMAAACARPGVVGAGGRIVPAWEAGARALPEELLWVVGATYLGHPEGPVPITRPIGASMAARRDALEAVGWFPSSFGPRDGRKTSSNEELALFTMLRRRYGADSVRYAPAAVVHHSAPAERTTWRYVTRRSWVEGTSKADARLAFGTGVMGHDGSYVRATLLPGIAERVLPGDGRGAARPWREAALCTTSLCSAAGGYLYRMARVGLRGPLARTRRPRAAVRVAPGAPVSGPPGRRSSKEPMRAGLPHR